eukprot:2217747-Amphidinium_carterae.1
MRPAMAGCSKDQGQTCLCVYVCALSLHSLLLSIGAGYRSRENTRLQRSPRLLPPCNIEPGPSQGKGMDQSHQTQICLCQKVKSQCGSLICHQQSRLKDKTCLPSMLSDVCSKSQSPTTFLKGIHTRAVQARKPLGVPLCCPSFSLAVAGSLASLLPLRKRLIRRDSIGGKLSLDDLATEQGCARLDSELRQQCFAILRCPSALKKRKEALVWLQDFAELPQEGRDGLIDESERGSMRFVEATTPRRVSRLDIVPHRTESLAASLACDLHNVGTTCLGSLASHLEMPELLRMVAPVKDAELLHEAREPSFLRANLYPPAAEESSVTPSKDPCWHMDLGLLTVAPVGSWPALMASPFHES